MLRLTDADKNLNGWRTNSMYSFSEAARLAGVSVTTVKNWLFGYAIEGREVPPLFPSNNNDMVSFLQLMEIMVAGRFRKNVLGKPVPFNKVREAYVNARESWGLEYPFAHLKLEALGGHIVHFLREGEVVESDQALVATEPLLKEGGAVESYQALDASEQWTLPGLLKSETTDQIEYQDELAARWFPIGKTVPIVVDPRVSTGLPIVEGRGVTVRAIHKRFKSGLRIDFIAKDFDLNPDLVETALQYWERVAA